MEHSGWVSSLKPSFQGKALCVWIWQRVGLSFECRGCGLWTSWSVNLPSGHSFTIVCSQQFKSSEGTNCPVQKQTLHCLFQIMFSWENMHLYSHPTVDKIISKISWMKAGAQRRLVNYLGQWGKKCPFWKNLWKPIASKFAWKLYYKNTSLLKIKHSRLRSIITAYRRVIEVIQFASHRKWPTVYAHRDARNKKNNMSYNFIETEVRKELGLDTVWAFNTHEMMIWSEKIIPLS